MKKLLTSAIAGLALIFGFASCAGGLHDNEVAPLYIEGVKGTREAMTKVSDSEMTYTFKYSSSLGGWHDNAGASIAFKTVVDESGWARDFGAPKDETITIKVGDEEYVPLKNREADNVGGAGPGNVLVYDLVEGEEYVIRMKYNAATLSGSIRIEGLSVVAPDLQIIARTDITSDTAKTSNVTMTRGGTIYTYEFIASDTFENFGFYLYCPSLTTTYKIGDTEEGNPPYHKAEQIEAKLYDAHGNLLDSKGSTTALKDYDYALDVRANAYKLKLVKNHKYAVKVEASDPILGYAGIIKVVLSEIDVLEDAVLVGQWLYTDSHDGDYAIPASGKFTAKDKTVKFKIIRDEKTNVMAFGGNVTIKPGDNYTFGSDAELNYVTTQMPSKDIKNEKGKVLFEGDGFTYTAARKSDGSLIDDENTLDATKKVDYITVENLKVDQEYEFDFDDENIEQGKIKIAVAQVRQKDLSAKIKSCVFKGSYDGWAGKSSCADFNDGKLTISGLVNEKGGADIECGIFEDVSNSSYMFRNATITCTGDVSTSEKVEFTEDSSSGANAHIKGLKPNAKFNIIITTEDGKVYVQVEVTDPGKEDTRSFAQIIAEEYYIKGSVTNEWWGYNVYATKTVDITGGKEIYYGPFEKSRGNGEFLLTNGGIYYKESKVKYLTGDNAYAQLMIRNGQDYGNMSLPNIAESVFPNSEPNYYIVVKVDSASEKVWAKIQPTTDNVDFYKHFLNKLTVSAWCRKWGDDGSAVTWVGVPTPGEVPLGVGTIPTSGSANAIWTADFTVPAGADIMDIAVHDSSWGTRYERRSTTKLSLDTEYDLEYELDPGDPSSSDDGGRAAFSVQGGKTYTVTYSVYYVDAGKQSIKYKLSLKE